MEILEDPRTEVETLQTPDSAIFLPTYVPTIEETVKASGGHRQAT